MYCGADLFLVLYICLRNIILLDMGSTESTAKVYAEFEGENKANESRILKHVMDILKPTDPKTMLEEFQ